ncbi:MAG: helicase C-terminal domain-containing protein [Candidatus Hodarchaeales archaeon]
MVDTSFLPPSLQLFPHKELRQYQSTFLRTVEKNPKVIIHAPVGFGKTIMALISTLPLVKQNGYQLFIFVRTKAQVFRIFLDEIYKIANSQKYGYLTALPLILKADLCLKKDEIPQFYQGVCSAIRCPLLEQTKSIPVEDFSTIVEQVPITSHNEGISIETYKEAFGQFGCPYYVIRRCIPYANIIVTTHTYLKSRNLQIMFSQLVNKSSFGKKIAIIDEGHNFSADIESELSLRELDLASAVIPLKTFDKLKNLIVNFNGRVDRPLELSSAGIDAFLDHERKLSLSEKMHILKVKEFITSNGDIWISENSKLLQINPFPKKTFDFVNSHFQRIILMSGTFHPISSYKTFYDVNYTSLAIPSDFQYSLNGIIYNRAFTSKYDARSYKTYENMANVIQRLHETNPFHTIVFTTSHDFKQKLLSNLSVPNIYVENIGMTPAFLDELRSKKHELILGVLGGKLSEGVEILDFNKRSLLTLIIIAGLPYPRPDMTSQYLQFLYTRRWGLRMAKHLRMLPVTRTISQAIGRGIRSRNDFAASLILDYRAVNLRTMLPPTRIFRDLQTLYNAYDLFFTRMRRLFTV